MTELRVQVDSDVRNPIIVSVSEYRREKRLDIRHHYEADGELRPTKKGISLPLDSGMTLDLALEEIQEPPLGSKSLVQPRILTREPIFVSVAAYKKEMRLDLRHYFNDGTGLQPGFKGVSLPWGDRDMLLAALYQILGETR